MRRLLLPDAGPLFSFAAGELLDVLLNFDLVISDVVKMETIDRGSAPPTSYESAWLAEFYEAHRQRIQIEPTQLGQLIGRSALKPHALSPQPRRPRRESDCGDRIFLPITGSLLAAQIDYTSCGLNSSDSVLK